MTTTGQGRRPDPQEFVWSDDPEKGAGKPREPFDPQGWALGYYDGEVGDPAAQPERAGGGSGWKGLAHQSRNLPGGRGGCCI